jgi:hypothetical protein
MQKLNQVFNVHGGEILNKKWSRELGCAIKNPTKQVLPQSEFK